VKMKEFMDHLDHFFIRRGITPMTVGNANGRQKIC